MITNKAGGFHEQLEYFPYGEMWVQEKVSDEAYSTPYKFTGKELDAETNFYYYGSRYYSPVISRWISADEYIDGFYSTLGFDLYGYVHGNPLKYNDPTGNSLDTPRMTEGGDLATQKSVPAPLDVSKELDGKKGIDKSAYEVKPAKIAQEDYTRRRLNNQLTNRERKKIGEGWLASRIPDTPLQTLKKVGMGFGLLMVFPLIEAATVYAAPAAIAEAAPYAITFSAIAPNVMPQLRQNLFNVHNPVSSNTQSGFSRTPCLIEHS